MMILASRKKINIGVIAAFSIVGLSTIHTPANASLRMGDLFQSYSTGSSGVFDTRGGKVLKGGEFTARFPRTNFTLASLSPPTASASCGGVDLNSGSFGFISSDNLVQVGRGIAQGAAVYFFRLAITDICPSCEKTMTTIQKTLGELNKFARNSCQSTMKLLAQEKVGADFAETFKTAFAPIDKAVDGINSDISTGILDMFSNDEPSTVKAELTNQNFTFNAIRNINNLNLGMFSALATNATNREAQIDMLISLLGAQVSTDQLTGGCTEAPCWVPVPHSLTIEQIFESDNETVTTSQCNDYIKCVSVENGPTVNEFDGMHKYVSVILKGDGGADRGLYGKAEAKNENFTADQVIFRNHMRVNAYQWVAFAEQNNIGKDMLIDRGVYGSLRSIATNLVQVLNNLKRQIKISPISKRDGGEQVKEQIISQIDILLADAALYKEKYDKKLRTAEQKMQTAISAQSLIKLNKPKVG